MHSIGKIVILDSEFCILKGIMDLFKKGTHSLVLIMKYHYWPKEISEKAIDERIVEKLIGATDTISRKLEGSNYNLFMIKDKDFTI